MDIHTLVLKNEIFFRKTGKFRINILLLQVYENEND